MGLTSRPVTMATSNTVGAMLNSKALRRKLTPLHAYAVAKRSKDYIFHDSYTMFH